jgi:hypothetical protein
MSSVIAAVFTDHDSAEQVRTELVKDGFPTDRVELTSQRELGQAKVIPAPGVADKLTQYFGRLFQGDNQGGAAASLRQAVLSGRAVIAVQPRGDVETNRAVEILNRAGPVELQDKDLDREQMFEQAASTAKAPVLNWVGKVLVAPGAQ